MGMLIIDEIHYPPPTPSVLDILGGAGSYSVLGARLLRKPENSHLIGWTVHVGNDFPAKVLEEIKSWKTNVNLIDTPERQTTRAWNKYGANEYREFKYLTPKIRIDETQLTENHLLAKVFHLICSPSRCIALVKGIRKACENIISASDSGVKDEAGVVLKLHNTPLFVWEPVPDSCTPEELPRALEALKYVDVISPNHHELESLFGETGKDLFGASELQVLERQCNELLIQGFGKKPSAVVVRRGERGVFIASDTGLTWLPAYHRPLDELRKEEQPKWTQKVIDPTGGGNAFLGGFCQGLLVEGRTKFEEAAIYGTVAASFAIEQIGMPALSYTINGEELWNGVAVRERLEEFRKEQKRGMAGDRKSFKTSSYQPIKIKLLGNETGAIERIWTDFDGTQYVPVED